MSSPRQPDIQVNVDATRMSQAFTGNGYIQNIINGEVNSFVARYRDNSEPLVSLKPGCALTRTSIPRGLAG